VHGARRHRPGATLALDPHGPPVRVRRGHGRIAEEVVGERQKGSQALG
jgi:hypothetical protein